MPRPLDRSIMLEAWYVLFDMRLLPEMGAHEVKVLDEARGIVSEYLNRWKERTGEEGDHGSFEKG